MDIPNLLRYVEPARVNVARLKTAVKTIEDGIATKHIWNTDYEDAKGAISRAWENIDNVAHDYLTDLYVYRTWQENDPRLNMGLCGFLNTPGWLAKLKKVKNAPELANYIAVIEEVAALAELVKAVKPYVVKGRKPAVLTDKQRAEQEADLKNTGMCPVCMKRQKLSINSTLVAHGYTVPRGWGGRNGMCMGHNYKAWELSPEGAVAFKEYMENYLARQKNLLADLQASKFPELREKVSVRKAENGRFIGYVDEVRTYAKGTPEYEKVRQTNIFSTERNIEYLNSDIASVGDRIKNWKAEPLKYGGAETQERWKSKLLKKESK